MTMPDYIDPHMTPTPSEGVDDHDDTDRVDEVYMFA